MRGTGPENTPSAIKSATPLTPQAPRPSTLCRQPLTTVVPCPSTQWHHFHIKWLNFSPMSWTHVKNILREGFWAIVCGGLEGQIRYVSWNLVPISQSTNVDFFSLFFHCVLCWSSAPSFKKETSNRSIINELNGCKTTPLSFNV